MMAEVLEQEVAPDSTRGLEIVPTQPAAAPAEPAPKPSRKLFPMLTVREDERQLPANIQIRLGAYRAEIHALNKALRERNQLIPRLRHEARLHARVMRLKDEARIEGRAVAIDQLAAQKS